MQGLSHYRKNDSRPPESVVYAVLTSLSCFCSDRKFRNSRRSCSTPWFIYLPNLSFINKYMFSWDLLSFFIIYLFLFMLIDMIQKFTPITFDYFIHARSYVLHFWNKTFNIIWINSSHWSCLSKLIGIMHSIIKSWFRNKSGYVNLIWFCGVPKPAQSGRFWTYHNRPPSPINSNIPWVGRNLQRIVHR